MNHNEIELKNVTKLFAFENLSREIDSIEDINSLRNVCKCYVKLYFKQQETLSEINVLNS
jgi:hypothetical protein